MLSGGDEEKLRVSKEEFRITVKVKDTTVIELMTRKLKEEGFKKVYLIARKKILNAVFQIIQNGSLFGIQFEYIEEKDSSGTGDTLKMIKGKINTNFLVVYGDILFNDLNIEELWKEHIKKKGMTTLLLTTTPDPSKKGVVKIEGSKILEFMQKPINPDIYLGFSSIFVSQPEILEYEGHSLEKDLFPSLAKKRLLDGYLTTSKVFKLRTKKDINLIK
ncbi:hypothetical protein HOK76_03010, partial [archaeon]|nr:hypothetical protein [archaeon]